MTRRPGLVLVLLVACCASARAEDERPGRFRFGPLYLTPSVVLTRYSGVSTTNLGAEADVSTNDFATLVPRMRGVVPIGRRLRFTGNTAANLGLFVGEKNLSFLGYGWGSGAELHFGPFTAFGAFGRGRGKERFSLASDELANRKEKTVAAGMSWRLSQKLTAIASRTHREVTHEAIDPGDESSVSNALDRQTVTYRYQAHFGLTRLTTVLLSADLIDDLFLADDKKVDSYRYTAGFQFSPLAFIRGRVLVGYRRLPEGQGVSGYNGKLLGVGATIPFFHFGTIGGSAEQDTTYLLSPSIGGPARGTVLVTRYRGDLRLQFPLSLVGAGHYEIDRIEDVQQLGARSGRRLRRYGGSLFRAFGRTLRLGGTIQGERFEGAPSGRTRYFVSAEWTP